MPLWHMHTDGTGRRTLTVRVRQTVESNVFEHGVPDATLIPQALTPRLIRRSSGRCVRLLYDVGHLRTIDEAIHDGSLGERTLKNMLLDIVATMRFPLRTSAHELCVCYDARYVFADDRYHLSFVLSTPSLMPRGDAKAPLDLLRHICTLEQTRPRSPNETPAFEQFARFVNSQRDVLSSNRLEEFVRGALLEGPRLVLEDGHTYVLGRAEECDIVLRDASRVSRRHARVRIEKGVAYLADMGSINGTFVNRRRLRSGVDERIEPGQTIVLGDIQVSLCTDRDRYRLEVCDGVCNTCE